MRWDKPIEMLLFLALGLMLLPIASATSPPANIMLQNNTANPAITFPSLIGISVCTGNFLGGTCIGNDVISGTQSLNNNLFVFGNVLVSSGTLTTGGFSIVASGGFNSLGATITTGTINNGAPAGAGTVNGIMGGNLTLSYAGSGGGSAGASNQVGGAFASAAGGNTLSPGGGGGAFTVNGGNGAQPSTPSVTNANIMIWFINPVSYLGGAGGASSAGVSGIGGGRFGGGGAEPLYIQANSIIAGNINAIGAAGQIGSACQGGGGGGGGAIILLANGLGTYTAGTYNVLGGSGGGSPGAACSGGTAGAGGNGGSGRALQYSYGPNTPIPVSIQQYYPIKITNGSGGGSLIFTLNSIYNGITTTLASGVSSLSVVPPANQPSGLYTYNIIETNTISNAISIVIANLSINMTDITPSISFNSVVIQTYPNILKCPIFTEKPITWTILNDKPQNNQANTSSPCQDVFSNLNITFTPRFMLGYSFTSFVANALNNPGLSITQNALTFISQTSSPPSPNTRNIITVSTYDQQSFGATNALNVLSFNWLINNYTGSNTITFPTNNSNTIWTGASNYQNPPICLSNIAVQSSAPSHTTAFNNYLATCLNSLAQGYNIYLVNTANAVQTQFIIYGSNGYGGYNDTLLIYTGSSTSNLRLVQTYLIQPNGVPFSITLQGNADQQQYQFKIINNRNQTLYTSGLSVPGSTVTINLPSSIVVPITPIINATASCAGTFNSIANAIYVTCTGIDLHNYITSWNVNILNVTSSINTTLPINSIWFNSTSSFSLIYPLSRKSTQYRFIITGYASTESQQMYQGTFNPTVYNLIGTGGQDIIAIVFFLLAVAFGQRTKSLSIIFVLVMLWILDAINVTNFGYSVLIGLSAAGIILIYLFESRNRGN